jgi:anti-anti-sigma factor
MTQLEYTVEFETPEVVRLELRGELAGRRWTKALQRSLEEHYLNDGVRRIRVDLGSLRFIDSSGVVTLISLHAESKRRNKECSVEGATGQVRDKLRVTGMLSFLEGGR